jgi:hypothetical protein
MQQPEGNAAGLETRPGESVGEQQDPGPSQRPQVETHWSRILHCDLFTSDDNARSETSCTC